MLIGNIRHVQMTIMIGFLTFCHAIYIALTPQKKINIRQTKHTQEKHTQNNIHQTNTVSGQWYFFFIFVWTEIVTQWLVANAMCAFFPVSMTISDRPSTVVWYSTNYLSRFYTASVPVPTLPLARLRSENGH